MATVEEITERIRGAVASAPDLGCRLKLDLKGEGVIRLDGTEVTNEDGPADLVITISRRDLEAIGKGELDSMRAVMTGRMKLSDMGLAMRLQPQIRALFSRAA